MLAELLRKSIHLSGLVLPVIYFFLDKSTMLIFVGILTGIAIAVELVKWVFPRVLGISFSKFLRLCSVGMNGGAR